MDLALDWVHGLTVTTRGRKYEYKFVRLGEGWTGVKKDARINYQNEIHRHARDGWRLVQVFAPGLGVYGSAGYFELILEREIAE